MLLLLTLAFAAQAAPPPAALACSADCPPAIYFDSGEGSQIRADWSGVLDAVAATARAGGTIRLDSFTDRTGPPAVNLRIARQRGEAVRQALVQRGVSAAAISVVAHGEADPRVATPDGVREAQNRRVDLTLIR